MMYSVLFHDYKRQISEIDYKVTSKYQALQYLEEDAIDFVIEKEGFALFIDKLYFKGDHQRKYGYFIERDPKKYLYRLKIIKKTKVKGIFFNTAKFEDVCFFDLIRIKRIHPYYDSKYQTKGHCDYESKYKKVLKQLKEKFFEKYIAPHKNILP